MRLLVINNLASGYREGAIYDFVRAFTHDGDEVVMRSTDGTTDLTTMLKDAFAFDAVVASGGDGTVTAVASALEGTNVPVLVFPAGTGNLVAQNLALPTEPHALAQLARNGKTLPFDMGCLRSEAIVQEDGTVVPTKTTHGFGLMAGAGFDAMIMQEAQPNKRFLGPLAYFQAAATHLKPQRSRFTITLDGKTVEADGMCVLIVNFSKIQFDISVSAGNSPRDGLLDVVVMKTSDALGLLPAFGAALFDKTEEMVKKGDVMSVYRARHVRVEADPPLPVQFDGEVANEQTPFEAWVVPGAAQFIVNDEGYALYAE